MKNMDFLHDHQFDFINDNVCSHCSNSANSDYCEPRNSDCPFRNHFNHFYNLQWFAEAFSEYAMKFYSDDEDNPDFIHFDNLSCSYQDKADAVLEELHALVDRADDCYIPEYSYAG